MNPGGAQTYSELILSSSTSRGSYGGGEGGVKFVASGLKVWSVSIGFFESGARQ